MLQVRSSHRGAVRIAALCASVSIFAFIFLVVGKKGEVAAVTLPVVGEGLTAEYFEQFNLTEHKATRIDANLSPSTLATLPSNVNGSDGFSARWTGYLQIPGTPGTPTTVTFRFSGTGTLHISFQGLTGSRDYTMDVNNGVLVKALVFNGGSNATIYCTGKYTAQERFTLNGSTARRSGRRSLRRPSPQLCRIQLSLWKRSLFQREVGKSPFIGMQFQTFLATTFIAEPLPEPKTTPLL